MRQFGKICEFITDNQSNLDYDWYIKIRPDVKLLQQINFDNLVKDAVNARARVYRGPKFIKYGMSVNGKGIHENVGHCWYENEENEIILDDCLFIFNHNIIEKGGFRPFLKIVHENEWVQTYCWLERNIKLNVIGVNLVVTKNPSYSGDVNMYIIK